jgi:hypothetical protein
VTASAGGVTPVSWAEALLAGLGAPVNATNVGTITGWEGAEGGAGPQFGVAGNVTNYNPLNVSLTTGPKGYGYDPGTGNYYPGSSPTPGNSPPIASFSSWATGLQATVDRLKEPFASGILKDLQNSDPTGTTASAVVASHWGTGMFSAGPSTGSGLAPGSAGGGDSSSTAPSSSASGSTDATLTGAFGIPGLPSWLNPASDLGSIFNGIENVGFVLLGVIFIIVGLIIVSRDTMGSVSEHSNEQRAKREPDVDVVDEKSKSKSSGAGAGAAGEAEEAAEAAAV